MDDEASDSRSSFEITAAGVRNAVAAWRASQERIRQRDRELNRLADRTTYRLAQERKGLTVRPYTRHDYEPKRPEEDHEEYERRKHRDRERAGRGVTAESVRSWTDLSALTPEEKAIHKAAQAAERKRRERARKRKPLFSDPGDIDVDEALGTLMALDKNGA